MNCVTCGDEILPERAELGFRYCTKPTCVRENREGLTVVEIAQHKTNSEYVILGGEAGDRALRHMREGKYRRDPVVVKREIPATQFEIPKGTFPKPKIKKRPQNRVKFVQALQAQGYGVDDIVEKGAYMNLTRSEVVQYMSASRRGGLG
ncbi:MAG: hypothetical protein JWR32_6417 [Mycobacterium sp.]|nr:hypothetical protein [Mycobacterium sp.]